MFIISSKTKSDQYHCNKNNNNDKNDEDNGDSNVNDNDDLILIYYDYYYLLWIKNHLVKFQLGTYVYVKQFLL